MEPPHEALPHFVVTGFGPFQGVADNPTTTIVKELLSYLSSKGECDIALSSCRAQQLASNVTTHVFETSAEDVRQWQDEWFDRLSRARGNDTEASVVVGEIGTRSRRGRDVVLLHLGVHYKAKCFHLESSAYNDASFRVPDERGYQPENECVSADGCAYGDILSTNLKVPLLVKKMKTRGYPTKLSGDPGRFVCNYTYFYSLDKCNRFNATASTSKAEKPTLYSIFVHVPQFQIAGKDEQFGFLVALMDEISLQLKMNQIGS